LQSPAALYMYESDTKSSRVIEWSARSQAADGAGWGGYPRARHWVHALFHKSMGFSTFGGSYGHVIFRPSPADWYAA